MEIRLDGHLVTTTMRTPGHDFELAVGFCHSEGLLADAAVEGIRYCGTGGAVATEFNVVSVSTGGRAPEPMARIGTTSSSCGLCGSTSIATLTDRLTPYPPDVAVRDRFEWRLLNDVALAVRDRQKIFEATGASHSGGIVRSGHGRGPGGSARTSAGTTPWTSSWVECCSTGRSPLTGRVCGYRGGPASR